jgi:DNA polymerase-3 subunit alpha
MILAGYTWLDADKFRKAMGKKIPSEMKKQKDKFITGAVKNGLTQKKAEELFDLIAPFAGYGFNKAHAACYATIAFRTAYLKAHYSVEFMTALLTAESRGASGPAKDEKIAQAVAECKRLKISLLPPDINKSGSEFAIEENKYIRFGLSAIKNVGEAAITGILDERKKGKYTSIENFIERLSGAAINKKTLESLIKAGAMDTFGKRAVLLATFPEIIEKITKQRKQQQEGQTSLFEETNTEQVVASSVYDDIDDFSDAEKLAFEKELLGIYLTAHPQAQYIEFIKTVITHELDILPEQSDGTIVTIGGFVESVKRIFTKKTGAEMAFISIGNEKGITTECIIFPKVFDQYKTLLIKDTVIIIEGRVDLKNEKPVILAQKIRKPNKG